MDRASGERERVSTSLRQFVKDAYPLMQTGTPLVWGWYLDAVCDFAQAIVQGDIKRGIVNLKNRCFKSGIVSVCLHPYDWLCNPGRRYFTGGYNHSLALEHSWASRQLINSEWYQTLVGGAWEMVGDQNEKGFYANTEGGRRLAAQVGGGTGKGGMVFVIDDPLGIDESWSDVANEKANRWLFNTVMSRLDDPKAARLLLCQHRLRPDDSTGLCIAEEHGFEVMSLPLEFDPKSKCVIDTDKFQFEDPREEPGTSLCEDRWGDAEIEHEKKSQGPLYEALSNQNPKKRGSKLVHEGWFRFWGADHPLPRSFDVCQSWDLSTKGLDPTNAVTKKAGRKRSKVGGICAYMTPSRCYIVDRFHEHEDYLGQKPAVRAMHTRHKRTVRTYVEDESNGSALILEMTAGEYTDDANGKPIKHPGIRGIVGVNPSKKGGKYQRLAAIAFFIRSGNVYLPDPDQYPWVRPFIQAVCEFPNFTYDEDPDVLSQLLSEEWLPDGLPAKDEVSAEEHAEKIVQVYGRSSPNPGVRVEHIVRCGDQLVDVGAGPVEAAGYGRVVIAGVPRAGKTTLAGGSIVPVKSTDDLIDLGWSQASERASQWFDEPGPWVVEGVACPRALRKWLKRVPQGKPCDRIVWLDRPYVELTPGQTAMAKGCRTVWAEVKHELIRRGVDVEER